MKAEHFTRLARSAYGALVVLSVLLPSSTSSGACDATHPSASDPSSDPRDEALELCRTLPGYDRLHESFVIERAQVGDFDDSDFSNSLEVELRTISPSVFTSVLWSDPLRKNGIPRFTWGTFLKLYATADTIVARHTWLTTWREASPGRSIELELHGDRIGEDSFEFDNFVLPVWRDAGFRGRPAVSILARRSGRAWAQLYFGAGDARALVTEVSGQEKTPLHWLDGLPIFFHPNCTPGDESSHYAVVQPSGHWDLMTFSGCEP